MDEDNEMWSDSAMELTHWFKWSIQSSQVISCIDMQEITSDSTNEIQQNSSM